MSELIGIVNVAGKAFTVSAMSQLREERLGTQFRQLAERQAGSPYSRAKDMIEEMPAKFQGFAVAEATRTKIVGELPGSDAAFMARGTKEGVRMELFARAKKHHPDLTEKELEAVVTDANCLDVLEDILGIITPKEEPDGSGPKS